MIFNSDHFYIFFFCLLYSVKRVGTGTSSRIWGSWNFFDISHHSKNIKKRKNIFLTLCTLFWKFFWIFVLVYKKGRYKICYIKDILVCFHQKADTTDKPLWKFERNLIIISSAACYQIFLKKVSKKCTIVRKGTGEDFSSYSNFSESPRSTGTGITLRRVNLPA